MVSSNGFHYEGGIASILTGVFLFSAHLINFLANLENGTILGQSLVFIAHIAAVFSFIGIYNAQGRNNRTLGSLGMVLSTTGTIIVSAIVYVEIARASGANVSSVFHEEVPNFILNVGPLLFVIGLLCLGISIILGKILSRRGGALLILGNIIFALGSFAGSAEAIFSVAGSAITGCGFIWLGLSLIKQKEAALFVSDSEIKIPVGKNEA
ncbi:hypothetical protein D1B33_17745 [Lysinibacillus yapensis]|uniref:DUF4386 family protein n=1 Tax=Ureibacillus yapensis TaxID=2304605 RepID=A0A396S6A9_9BACL|nr:hypothetical protein [Lysinibacillus yapensis]RHW31458.1 hypothetical protein D1B33_17745 [Lysinibacillus yapensis]